MTRYEDLLGRDGFLVYKGMGNSMAPFIRSDKDLIIIEPAAGRLKKYDVALYRRPDGRYILHRVLAVRPHDYAIRGDNAERMEYGITDNEILGVMRAFVRDGKRIETSNPRYRLEVRLWLWLYPMRRLWKKIRRFPRKARERCKKMGRTPEK